MEDTASYRRLKSYLLADQSNVHRIVMHEKTAKIFQNQMNPGYKGVIRSKPYNKFKIKQVEVTN